MQETYMYCDIRFETELKENLKPAVGTLIQYLLDRDTFNLRIQCCVLEVP